MKNLNVDSKIDYNKFLVEYLKENKLKIMTKLRSTVNQFEDDDELLQFLFENDAFLDVYSLLPETVDNSESFCDFLSSEDYHNNEELQNLEIDLWITASNYENRTGLVTELNKIKREGL